MNWIFKIEFNSIEHLQANNTNQAHLPNKHMLNMEHEFSVFLRASSL